MEENKNRRKFIKEAISAIALSSLAIPALASSQKTGKMVKMLTADGKLVEVEESILKNAAKKKAGNKDIMNWVTPKT